MKKLTIIVNNQSIEVEDIVYKAYYQSKEREKYLQKKSRLNECSIEYFQLHGISLEPNLSVQVASTEELYFKKLEQLALYNAIKKLAKEEQYIIIAAFYQGKKEYEIAANLGVSQPAVCKRKKRILAKLNRILTED